MAIEFPNEIIEAVAFHLPSNNLCTCLRVCRLWNSLFTPILYRVVRIRKRYQFRLFYQALVQTESLNHLGRHVHELYLNPGVGFSRFEFDCLQLLCPYLATFNFNCKLWDYLRVSTAFENWKHLKQLPHLYLDQLQDRLLDDIGLRITKLKIDIKASPDWFGLLKKLSHVQDLCIFVNMPVWAGSRSIMSSISFSELEALHATLPALRTLSLSGLELHGDMPKHILPCDTLRFLEWNTSDDYRWYRYFAHKYPKVETLTTYMDLESECEKTQMEFVQMARSFQHLKVLSVRHPGRKHSRPYQQFLETILDIKAPISEMEFHYRKSSPYARAVSGFHRTLSKLTLLSESIDSIAEVYIPLMNCLSLVELRLDFARKNFEIDDILNALPRLKVLNITAATICLNNSKAKGCLNRLETLSLCAVDIADDVFPYISKLCPHLLDLTCEYELGFPKSCVIDLSGVILRSICVKGPSNAAFNLVQTDKSKPVLEQKEERHGAINRREVKHWDRWYCTEKKIHLPIIRRLKPSEVEKIMSRFCCGGDGQIKKRMDTNHMDQGWGHGTIISIRCRSASEIGIQWIPL
ncbi:hypothetical protein DFQ28_008083 [Apophysomyces sp. BC1034]|nr:hypothetical protein DFQ30_010371 [Apophysomyces sp. BC1015]KAG0180676.1 hypothetical protein DFQ29_000188 [Apophysomyces sp. BC1021]KAG0186271.1 hypothetical protein DFQ28_008083 [Apophysomyces sp. BC1034]